MINEGKAIFVLFFYRIIMAILTRNYEYPDEHWQGNQIAHYIHYGYGYLTWQWTLSLPLRNPVYPYLLSISYYFVDLFGLQFLSPYAPRLFIQVPFAVLTDYFILKILKQLHGKINWMMLLCVFGNWYYASTLIRIYYNSFETGLTVIAYYFWFTNGKVGNNNIKDLINRTIVGISYVTRPTTLMAWAFLWPYQLYQIAKKNGIFSFKSIQFFFKNILNLLIMTLISFIIGSFYFNKFTLTQANFIKFNFVQKWSELYGKQPKYFYFLLSMPFIVNFGLIFVLFSVIQILLINNLPDENKQIKRQRKQMKILFIFIIFYLFVSSFSTHKQHRFIFPIIPFALILSTYIFKQGNQQVKLISIKIPNRAIKTILALVALTNILIFIGFNAYGKSNDKAAWSYINQQIENKYKNFHQNQISVIVMGQSHFMPGYSLLHRNITYIIPDSTPMKMLKNESQNQYLNSDPQLLYQKLTRNDKIKANYIIAQGRYLNYTSSVLNKKGYKQTKVWRYFTLIQQLIGYYDYIAIYEPQQIKI